tara:strand:- start:362 stop:973 length:612 start_codon:yes stop_codon:yes gene_type:complete
MADKFAELLQKGLDRNYIPRETTEAIEWFRNRAAESTEFKSIQPGKILKLGESKRKNRTTFTQAMIGSMYLFEYDPKLKDTLPYYDQFPLVFPIETYSDSFLGINLHYIFPAHRAILMDSLYDLTIAENTPEKTRLYVSYKILKKAARYKYYKPCVKRYLKKNISSKFMKVMPDEWDIALFLPLERFSGASKRSVWAESRRKI